MAKESNNDRKTRKAEIRTKGGKRKRLKKTVRGKKPQVQEEMRREWQLGAYSLRAKVLRDARPRICNTGHS